MNPEQALETIKKDVTENRLFLYMKGTPEQPMCGFSAQVVQLLHKHGITDLKSRNVMDEWEIREGVKKFTNWPTIPQLYVDGKFIGGCDILMDMDRKGSLAAAIKAES